MKLDREFWKKLKSLVFPIAFQQVMLALVSATDAVMLGMLSQDAMSAVSLAGLLKRNSWPILSSKDMFLMVSSTQAICSSFR